MIRTYWTGMAKVLIKEWDAFDRQHCSSQDTRMLRGISRKSITGKVEVMWTHVIGSQQVNGQVQLYVEAAGDRGYEI